MRANLDARVLAALAGVPAHGYRVTMRLDAGVPDGTVYPVLHRLERDGLVRSAWRDVDGRRRRLYELTGAGATALDRLAAAAQARVHDTYRLRWSV
jgi:DNA-binding PadR family transcriptional regulator